MLPPMQSPHRVPRPSQRSAFILTIRRYFMVILETVVVLPFMAPVSCTV